MAETTEDANAGVAIDPALIERWASAHLERFPSSAANLRRVLLRRVRRRGADAAAAAPAIDALIARYRELGLMADVAAALATVGEGRDLAAACAFARRRKLGPFRRGAGDRARELAAFARAGFSRRDAEAVLDCADAEAVAALLGG